MSQEFAYIIEKAAGRKNLEPRSVHQTLNSQEVFIHDDPSMLVLLTNLVNAVDDEQNAVTS